MKEPGGGESSLSNKSTDGDVLSAIDRFLHTIKSNREGTKTNLALYGVFTGDSDLKGLCCIHFMKIVQETRTDFTKFNQGLLYYMFHMI